MKTRTHIALGLALSVVASACTKNEASEPTATATTTETSVTSTEPGVTANTGNTLALGGSLNINLGLNALTKGVLLFVLDGNSKLTGAPTEVEVDADGKFSVSIDRNRTAKLEAIIVNGVADKSKAKEAFPQYASEIDGMSNEELVEGLSQEIESLKENPNMRYVLVSYDKSGDREAEAASMQFIGLPTAGQNLKMLPGEALKGDMSLGKIEGSGDEATSTLTAADSLDLTASVLEEMASASQTMKFLKNVWMNPDEKVEVTPWFGYANTDIAGTVNKFTTPANLTYSGGGYYIRPRNIGATWGEVCPANPNNPSDKTGVEYSATPAKSLEWYPPVDMASYNDPTVVFGPNKPYTNMSGTYQRQDQYGETSCSSWTSSGGMYTRAESETDTSFQLQLGEFIKGKVAEGLWRLKVAGTEVGRWDLSAAAPFDKDGDPVIYIPAIKVIVADSGKATGFQAKFYFFDKVSKGFREVTDVSGLKKMLHSFNMDGRYQLSRSGGDLSVGDIKMGDDGIVSGDLPADAQEAYPCPDSSSQCITTWGMSYFIGNISYRMSISANASP